MKPQDLPFREDPYKMTLLFSVDPNWNIGYKGHLLMKIKEDLQTFKRLTTGQIVVMGRATFETLPHQKPLKERVNIILTRSKDFQAEGAYVVHDETQLMELLQKLIDEKPRRAYMIGGGKAAKTVLHQCNRAMITKIYKEFEKADASLHNLDQDPAWQLYAQSPCHEQDGINFQYHKYVRVKGDTDGNR